MLFRTTYIVFLLIFATFSAPSIAQEIANDDPEKAAAEAFAEGIQLYEKMEYDRAAEAFRAANKIKFNRKVLYNIAQCEAAAKRYGVALQTFEEYLARSGDDITVERRGEVLAEMSRLRQMVGMLEIEAPAGAMVLVDDAVRGTAPLAGPIMISSGVIHTIVVVHNEKTLMNKTMRMSGGQQKMLRVEAEEEKKVVAEQAPEKEPTEAVEEPVSENEEEADAMSVPTGDSGGNGLKTGGIISLGIGSALLVGGITVGAIGYSNATELDKDYPDGVPKAKEGEVDAANNMTLTADILMGVGAAAIIAGTVLLIVNKKKQKESLAVAPVATPQFAGAVLTGRF